MHCSRIEPGENDSLKTKHEKLKIEEEQPELKRGRPENKYKKVHFQRTKVAPNATEKAANVTTRHTDDKKLDKGRKGKVKVAKGHLNVKMESDLGEPGNNSTSAASSPSSRSLPPRTAPGRRV